MVSQLNNKVVVSPHLSTLGGERELNL